MALELKQQGAGKTARANPNAWWHGIAKARQPRVTAKDRMFFTEQLALMLETGVNLHNALVALKSQSNKPAVEQLIDQLANHVAEGKTFSYALSLRPDAFPSTYVNLIAASEQGGYTAKILEKLLAMEEKREELKSVIQSAMSYPAFLLIFSVAVVIFILVAVFPKFDSMFGSIRDQLPAMTLMLMALSELIRAYWMPLLAGLAAGSLFIVRIMKTAEFSARMDRLKLTLPGVKNIFVQLYLLQALQVMSLALGNGVSVIDTLASCKDVVRNKAFRAFLVNIENKVQQGEGIAAGFQNVPFIPPIVQRMITTGDETGHLHSVMARLAAFYERELTKRLMFLSKIAEPLMLVIMGIVVGVLVSSLILPIFKLSKAV